MTNVDYVFTKGLIFIAGVIIESFLLTDIKKFKQILFLVISSLFIVFLQGDMNFHKDDFLLSFVFNFTFTYSILFVIALKEEILKPINELILIVWNLFFLCIYFNTFKSLNIFSYIIFLFSLITIINGYTKRKANKFFKVFFYCWFLFMIMFVAIKNFSLYNLRLIFSVNSIGINYFTVFMAGMTFLYLIVHFCFLFRMLPIPSKHQSFAERIEEWKYETDLMSFKFSNKQSKPVLTSLIIVIFVGFYFMNSKMIISDGYLMVNLAVFFATVLELLENKYFSKDVSVSNSGV